MRHIDDDERRALIGVRHAVAPSWRVPDPVAATRAMTVLHATEPPTPYLSVHARVDGVTREEIDRVLHDDRSLVKQLAMRRTLFVFPQDLLPAAWGGPAARVAGQERRKIAANVVAAGLTDDGHAWLDEARAQVLAALATAGELTVAQVKEAVPMLAGKVASAPTSKWGGETPIAPRVLTWMGAEASIVRGRNAGHWRISRASWTPMEEWLGESPTALDEPSSYAEIVGRWLRTFGPGTEADLVWWLGATKSAVRRALADVAAVEVTLDGGARGWVHPDDAEAQTPEVEPWAALLPVLDPTTMGWRDRDFYLDPRHTPYLFDTNGNAGTTAWWGGRIVGCWVQRPDGVVVVVPQEDLPALALAALAVEAGRLTAWLDGVVVNTVYASLQMKSARLP